MLLSLFNKRNFAVILLIGKIEAHARFEKMIYAIEKKKQTIVIKSETRIRWQSPKEI